MNEVSADTPRSGGCLCGQVRFTVTGNPDYAAGWTASTAGIRPGVLRRAAPPRPAPSAPTKRATSMRGGTSTWGGTSMRGRGAS